MVKDRRRDDWLSMSGSQRRAFTAQLVLMYGARCCICGLPLDPAEATCQHLIPRSKGGITTVSNCRPAHGACNYSLGNRETDGPAGIIHDGLAAFNINFSG